MHDFINLIVNYFWNLWYSWIFIMMLIESSFIPFPSEIAMIPAWYLASKWELNFFLALFVWTIWAISWASINYIIGYYYWEKYIIKFIKKYWKYFFINLKHYKKASLYFEKYWALTIFTARFIPAIRQIITMPAWIFKMDYPKVFFYTSIWAWLWNLLLMIIWYIAWENQVLIDKYTKELIIMIIAIIIIIISYNYIKSKNKLI